MSETNKTTNVEKKLKRKEFDTFDTSLACISFIVFQLVFELIYYVLPTSFKGNLFVALLLSFLVEGLFALAAITVSSSRNVKLVEATKMNKKIDFLSALLAIAISLVCLFSFTGLTNVFVAVLEKIGYSQVVSDIAIPNFLVYLIYVFLICICPAFFEELLFRGVICSGLKERGTTKAVMLSALIFMLMHGGPDQTVHQFILGIVLGYAFIYSNSLWVPVIIHFVNNFVAVTMLFISSFVQTSGEVVATEPVSWVSIIMSLAFALISAAIGGVLIWLCIKGLKNLKEKRDKKQLEKKLAVLDKAELSENDIQSLKGEGLDSEEPTSLTRSMNNLEKKKKINTYTIVLYVISGLYLVINWVLTLVQGFLM